MKILVLGSEGQLGRCLRDQFAVTDYEVIFTSRKEADLSNTTLLRAKILLAKPDVVINAAAFTAVDNAENEANTSDLINHLAVASIADACNELGSWIIHISTDYVFDGTAKSPYKEDEKTNPNSVYGKSKLRGEISIKASGSKYLIIRTAWVFSEYGNNFLKTMLQIGRDRNELNIVNDQIGCPTYAQDIAKVIISMLPSTALNKTNSGIFHFCGDHSCTWYEFAKFIFLEAKALGLKTPEKVNPIKTMDYPTLAVRPSYSVLECSKIKNTFNVSRSNWRIEIKNIIKRVNNLND
tara:strand:- start:471 stop:1355 length:885 start_codon:yes stop_codon:yes gene_type:complete